MKLSRKKFLFVFLIFCVISILSIFGFYKFIYQKSKNPINKKETKLITDSVDKPFKGVSFSPKSFSGLDMINFFTLAKQAGQAITWAGDWYELGDEKKFPHTFMKLSEQYEFLPVPIVGLYNQGEKKLIRPLTNEVLENYKKYTIDFVRKYKPTYLGIGVEVDIMFENHPSEFEKFVLLFNDTVKEIKKISPKTSVFTAFQLERTKGLRGGLFGGKNDLSQNNWTLLEKFPLADIVAFTTYPHLIYPNPSSIPEDFYTEISKRTTKPTAFIETGWPSENIASGWESNEEEQAQFVNIFASRIKNLEKKLVVWPFVYDVDAGAAFKGLGLITKTNHRKTSWEIWKNKLIE